MARRALSLRHHTPLNSTPLPLTTTAAMAVEKIPAFDSTTPPTPAELDAAAELTVRDEYGKDVPLASLYKDQKTVCIWIRHFVSLLGLARVVGGEEARGRSSSRWIDCSERPRELGGAPGNRWRLHAALVSCRTTFADLFRLCRPQYCGELLFVVPCLPRAQLKQDSQVCARTTSATLEPASRLKPSPRQASSSSSSAAATRALLSPTANSSPPHSRSTPT